MSEGPSDLPDTMPMAWSMLTFPIGGASSRAIRAARRALPLPAQAEPSAGRQLPRGETQRARWGWGLGGYCSGGPHTGGNSSVHGGTPRSARCVP